MAVAAFYHWARTWCSFLREPQQRFVPSIGNIEKTMWVFNWADWAVFGRFENFFNFAKLYSTLECVLNFGFKMYFLCIKRGLSTHNWLCVRKKKFHVPCTWGMETFRGQWHLVDTIFQNGRLLVDILKGWLFVDTFGDISWTILVKGTLFSARLG